MTYSMQIITNILLTIGSAFITVSILNNLNKINVYMTFFSGMYMFLCEHNPLIINYLDTDDIIKKVIDENISNEIIVNKPVQKFEEKYLEKFKKFPNEFIFNEEEKCEITSEFERIKIEIEKNRLNSINEIQENLFKINEIQENSNKNDTELPVNNLTHNGLTLLLKFFSLEDEYDDDPDDINFEELYTELITKKIELEKQLSEVEQIKITDEEIQIKARDIVINNKLEKLINNYVLEFTPLGNIYMRYNNSKQSFEYFSNSTIPYRYLEPVGRKYVMTYWCKPLFVDIEEELKIAEIKFDEEKKKNEDDIERRKEDTNYNPKNVLAKLKNYNKDTINQNNIKPQMKNRVTSNVLPPQIKANLPNVNQHSEKQLLKEKSNRYTWEGRLTNFSPLKKIDKKIVNKQLEMTFADFKKMQLELQNKK
jgi:hypothetical protein